MSKLLITREDIEKALRQYYQDYEPELFRKYDFENSDLYFEDKKLGYLDVKFVVPEKLSPHNPPKNSRLDGSDG